MISGKSLLAHWKAVRQTVVTLLPEVTPRMILVSQPAID